MTRHERLLDACDSGCHQVLHRPNSPFCDAEELIVRHTLNLKDPLPRAFVGMVRAQHLQGDPLPSASASCINGLLKAKDEMRSLLLISMLLNGKTSELRGSDEEDRQELSGPLPQRRRLALLQRCGEREVLQRAAAEVERLQLACVRGALRSVTTAEKCSWAYGSLLAAVDQLRAQVASVASLSKNLFDRLPAPHLLQSCHLINLWVVGLLCPDTVGLERLRLATTTWPLELKGETMRQPEVWDEDASEYSALYVQKLRLWGSWLFGLAVQGSQVSGNVADVVNQQGSVSTRDLKAL